MPDPALMASTDARATSARIAASAPPPSFPPVGKWQPVRLLGRGRWTNVFQARPIRAHETAPADYVVKTLRSEHAADPLAIAAITREAIVARQVNHPHLAALLDAHARYSPHYVVYPYEPAVSARALLAEPLAISLALWIARQTAEALASLHGSGWLHGDVKPDNILVARQGRATLIDLGLARRLDSEECECFEAFSGTCVYCAPEALLPHERLTAAHDVYSLGITLFELLVGQPPMDTSDRTTVAAWHLRAASPDLRGRLPHAPLRLARLIRAMLARQPLRRPTMSEVIPWIAELEIETLAM